MRSLIRAVQLLGLSIGVFLACQTLFAQTFTGRILGTVTDQTGAALAGAADGAVEMSR